jgi:crossover junction endodeoxyribonuclease RuvC
MAKIIMGIDPGSTVTGYGIISCEGKKMTLLGYGLIRLGKTEVSHAQKLKKIFDRISSLVEEYCPDEVAIESPFQGKNIQSMLKLGRAQGVAMAAALSRDIPVVEYAPRKVKMAVAGNGNATKEQVAKMLETLLKFEYDQPLLDAADGLALAVCHFFQVSSSISGTQSKGWGDFLANNPSRIVKK